MKTIKKYRFIILAVLIAITAVSVSSAFIISATRKSAEPDKSIYTIRFLDSEGNLIKERKVEEGGFAVPPKLPKLPANIIFEGWNGTFLNVTSDGDCRVSTRDISEKPNVFYVPAQYVECGKKFELKVSVGGNVSLDTLEFSLPYNSDIMKFISADSDYGSVKNDSGGKVAFVMDTGKTIREGATLTTIKFKAAGKPFVYADLQPEITLAQHTSPDGETNADYQIVSGRVYQYENQ